MPHAATAPLIDTDVLNPKFTWECSVHFDELDPMQILHNSRYAANIERAITAFYESCGGRWERVISDNPDQFHGVRDIKIEFLSPFHGTGRMRIDIWVERLGTTSCSYGFLCSSPDGVVPYARGERTIVKMDPATYRPIPWTDRFRQAHSAIIKDLPAYA